MSSKRSRLPNTGCLITPSSLVTPLKSSIRAPPFGLSFVKDTLRTTQPVKAACLATQSSLITAGSSVTPLKSSIRLPPFGLTLTTKHLKNNVSSKRSLPRNKVVRELQADLSPSSLVFACRPSGYCQSRGQACLTCTIRVKHQLRHLRHSPG